MAQSKYSESISESISSSVSQPESSSSVVPRSDDFDADCSTSSATAVNLLLKVLLQLLTGKGGGKETVRHFLTGQVPAKV